MKKLWFTADLHLGHAKINRLARRGWPSLDAMHDALVRGWQACVAPTDEVWVLGDFAFGKAAAAIFDWLPGEKHLVVGNHDEKNKHVLRLPWVSQHQLTRVKYKDTGFVLCHYPLESWPWAHHGVLHVHGHSHGTSRVIPHRYDVGVDATGAGHPVSADDLIWLANHETFQPTDHHGASSSG